MWVKGKWSLHLNHRTVCEMGPWLHLICTYISGLALYSSRHRDQVALLAPLWCDCNLKWGIFQLILMMKSWAFSVKSLSDKWVRKLFDVAIRQQSISWSYADQDLQDLKCHVKPLGHNELSSVLFNTWLTHWGRVMHILRIMTNYVHFKNVT